MQSETPKRLTGPDRKISERWPPTEGGGEGGCLAVFRVSTQSAPRQNAKEAEQPVPRRKLPETYSGVETTGGAQTCPSIQNGGADLSPPAESTIESYRAFQNQSKVNNNTSQI